MKDIAPKTNLAPDTNRKPARLTLLEHRLIVGDIICTGDNTTKSVLIRRNTGGGPVSHVALYEGDGIIIEAVLPKVRQCTVDEFNASFAEREIHVLRPKLRIMQFKNRPNEAKSLRLEASFYGISPYSILKAIGTRFLLFRFYAAKDAVICSELVVKSYSRAGIELCPGRRPDSISPNDIFASDKLMKVTRQCTSPVKTAGSVPQKLYPTENFWAWLGAFAWAISPARRARATPMEKWRTWDFMAYCLVRWLAHKKFSLRVASARVQNYSTVPVAHDSRLRLHILAEAKKVKSAILNHRDAVCGTYADFPELWRGKIRRIDRNQMAQLYHYHRVLRKLRTNRLGTSTIEDAFRITKRLIRKTTKAKNTDRR